MKSPSILLSLVAAVAMTFGLSTSTAYAKRCTGDLNQDQIVDGQDLAILLTAWGTIGGSGGTDINGDGTIDGTDLASVLSGWGPCGPTCNFDFWGTVLEILPNPIVVTDANLRNAIIKSGLPWRVEDCGTKIEMLLVPAGIFTMGCSASNSYLCNSNETPHIVTLTQAFYMGRYEVTQAQWQAKMGSNPSYFQGASYPDAARRPVERVSWNMIAGTGGFISGTGLRLPTEAEWEYAYRAGTITAFHSYPTQPTGFSNDALLGNIAWYDNSQGNETHVVGGKNANALGLRDMSGNVMEWCQDWYSPFSSAELTNPAGPASGVSRLLRGGSYLNNSGSCRASWRGLNVPTYNSSQGVGFRAARTPP